METKTTDYCKGCLHSGICMYEKKYEELTSTSILELLDIESTMPFKVNVVCDRKMDMGKPESWGSTLRHVEGAGIAEASESEDLDIEEDLDRTFKQIKHPVIGTLTGGTLNTGVPVDTGTDESSDESEKTPRTGAELEIPDFLKSKSGTDIAEKLENFADSLIDNPNREGGKIVSKELK